MGLDEWFRPTGSADHKVGNRDPGQLWRVHTIDKNQPRRCLPDVRIFCVLRVGAGGLRKLARKTNKLGQAPSLIVRAELGPRTRTDFSVMSNQ
jgi:hypothetical protein